MLKWSNARDRKAIVPRKGSAVVQTVTDFEDMLDLLDKHRVRYLIIGGLAFIYHGKPRYTRDMDLWVEPSPENVRRANAALAEFGSPYFLDVHRRDEIVQIGVAPNRIDLLLRVTGARFETAWKKRIEGRYGRAKAYWVDIDTLIRMKSRLDEPRHQEDARVLREVKKLRRARARQPRKHTKAR